MLIAVLAAIVFGAGGFFGGMQYQKNQALQLRQLNGQGGNQGQGRRFGANGTRPTAGDIISADDKSITVKMMDGSSKIVILSDKTQINKAATATKSDLKVGERVAVFGTDNSDGSVTAANIQLNPQLRGAGSSPSASPK